MGCSSLGCQAATYSADPSSRLADNAFSDDTYSSRPKRIVAERRIRSHERGSLRLSHWALKPFDPIEVQYLLKGAIKGNECDWIGMFEGTDLPRVDDHVSSMMATGLQSGKVAFTAPNRPGVYHFRYFCLDDSEVVASPAFEILSMGSEDTTAVEDIHIRDALQVAREVKIMQSEDIIVEDLDELDMDEGRQPGGAAPQRGSAQRNSLRRSTQGLKGNPRSGRQNSVPEVNTLRGAQVNPRKQSLNPRKQSLLPHQSLAAKKRRQSQDQKNHPFLFGRKSSMAEVNMMRSGIMEGGQKYPRKQSFVPNGSKQSGRS